MGCNLRKIKNGSRMQIPPSYLQLIDAIFLTGVEQCSSLSGKFVKVGKLPLFFPLSSHEVKGPDFLNYYLVTNKCVLL